MMLVQGLLLTALVALSSLSTVCGQIVARRDGIRNLQSNNLPPCKSNDFETDFYTVDTSIDALDNVCNLFQLATIGAFIQDIIEETENLMPEYKKEYMRALVCPFAEEDNGRRLLFETDHRKLLNRWRWKGRRGTCRRCRNRTTARYLSAAAITANNVCAETEKVLHYKMKAQQSFETVDEILVSSTEMAWLRGKEYVTEIQVAEEALREFDRASTMAATAVRKSITLCEQALANEDSPFRIKKLMRRAEQATKEAEDASQQTADILARVEHLKKDMETSIELVDSRRELGSSSDEDATVGDVCAMIEAAKFHQSLAERDLQHAKDMVQAMKDMSKDYWNYKEVQKVLKYADKACEKVQDKKDDTLKKVEDVVEQCDKAKEKPHYASKLLKEARKKTEDVAKKAIETNEKLFEVKEEELEMFQLAEILGFDPTMAELEETVKADNERISKDIKRIEEEIDELNEQLKRQGSLSDAQVQLLEQKKAAYVQQKQYLQGILLSNNKIIATQEALQRENYYTSIGRSSQQGRPLEIVLVSNGIRNVNWNPYTQTTTLSDWFEKFASLLLDALETGLPRFNSTTGGCLDGPFEVTVNVTEVDGVLDAGAYDESCVNTVFDEDER